MVTGMSGAGRRSVLSALEDNGYTTLDNIPARLLEPLLALQAKLYGTSGRLAFGMDGRAEAFTEDFLSALENLREQNHLIQILFVEADDDVLQRRFSESRRPHPLSPQGSVLEGIAKEREKLSPVKAQATALVNTSRLNLMELRLRLAELLPALSNTGPTLRLVSFGFKHGIPEDADMVLDARFLPNPHYVPHLKPMSGLDAPVREWLNSFEPFRGFLDRSEAWVEWMWPQVQREGRAYFTLAIGCTGGQHRSVALTELLCQRLRSGLSKIIVHHRELGDPKS